MYVIRGFFFFNDTATTEIYTLSLHDALPISRQRKRRVGARRNHEVELRRQMVEEKGQRVMNSGRVHHMIIKKHERGRSEEHTSELQSRQYLVCRLLLEKKNRKN